MARSHGKKNKTDISPARLLAVPALLVALAGCGPTVQPAARSPQVAPPPIEPLVTAPAPSPDVRGAPLGAPMPDDRIEVALLLPLSGPNAAMGQALLDAAQIALFDVADGRFELLPRDTGGTASGAQAALSDALIEGAEMVLGPLTGSETAAIKSQAQAAGVPVVTFSTDWTILGGGTYTMGFLPFEQVQRVVDFASRQGYRRIGGFLPNNLYGAVVSDSLGSAAATSGAVVADVERYDPQAPDLTAQAQALAATPLDALILAEGGERAEMIAQRLRAAGIDTGRVRLLGTGLWDDLTLGQRAPSLVGGWFAAPPPDARADFERRFQQLYGYAPPRLATLGYDAVALAATLAKAPGLPAFDDASLTQPAGFIGVDGIFRFTPDGRIDRGLAVLEVRPDGLAVVEPAPTDFTTRVF